MAIEITQCKVRIEISASPSDDIVVAMKCDAVDKDGSRCPLRNLELPAYPGAILEQEAESLRSLFCLFRPTPQVGPSISEDVEIEPNIPTSVVKRSCA